MAAFSHPRAGDMKADETRRARDQYCPIRHRILKGTGSAPPHRPGPVYPPYPGWRNTPSCGSCQLGFKTIPRRRSSARGRHTALFWQPTEIWGSAGEMRQILLSTIKILISAALLYFALRKANFSDLASRIDVASVGWSGMAIAVTFLQISEG